VKNTSAAAFSFEKC
jgi:hypothetical protein